jgi:hypothetical protein
MMDLWPSNGPQAPYYDWLDTLCLPFLILLIGMSAVLIWWLWTRWTRRQSKKEDSSENKIQPPNSLDSIHFNIEARLDRTSKGLQISRPSRRPRIGHIRIKKKVP